MTVRRIQNRRRWRKISSFQCSSRKMALMAKCSKFECRAELRSNVFNASLGCQRCGVCKAPLDCLSKMGGVQNVNITLKAQFFFSLTWSKFSIYSELEYGAKRSMYFKYGADINNIVLIFMQSNTAFTIRCSLNKHYWC